MTRLDSRQSTTVFPSASPIRQKAGDQYEVARRWTAVNFRFRIMKIIMLAGVLSRGEGFIYHSLLFPCSSLADSVVGQLQANRNALQL